MASGGGEDHDEGRPALGCERASVLIRFATSLLLCGSRRSRMYSPSSVRPAPSLPPSLSPRLRRSKIEGKKLIMRNAIASKLTTIRVRVRYWEKEEKARRRRTEGSESETKGAGRTTRPLTAKGTKIERKNEGSIDRGMPEMVVNRAVGRRRRRRAATRTIQVRSRFSPPTRRNLWMNVQFSKIFFMEIFFRVHFCPSYDWLSNRK